MEGEHLKAIRLAMAERIGCGDSWKEIDNRLELVLRTSEELREEAERLRADLKQSRAAHEHAKRKLVELGNVDLRKLFDDLERLRAEVAKSFKIAEMIARERDLLFEAVSTAHGRMRRGEFKRALEKLGSAHNEASRLGFERLRLQASGEEPVEEPGDCERCGRVLRDGEACPGCGELYSRESDSELRERVRSHIRDGVDCGGKGCAMCQARDYLRAGTPISEFEELRQFMGRGKS